jgi:hypothetical protein
MLARAVRRQLLTNATSAMSMVVDKYSLWPRTLARLPPIQHQYRKKEKAMLRNQPWRFHTLKHAPKKRLGMVNIVALSATLAAMGLAVTTAVAEPIKTITIDGNFDDWDSVPAYSDAAMGQMHTGTNIPDVHDTDGFDPAVPGDVPDPVDHPDVDLREFKFTHDESNLYGYFRSAGVIGRTAHTPEGQNGPRGRYYVIVTIDVDNDDTTGYWLHDGGYAPTSNGYDMNFELEFFNGTWNTGHYLSHDATSQAGEDNDIRDLTNNAWNGNYQSGPYTPGFVQPAPGNYDNYTQWSYHDNDTLTLVSDRGPVVPGIITMQLSPDGHEVEIRAPFKGFLKNQAGDPNMALGKTLDISFSLEASGDLAPGGNWASDTGATIVGYYLSPVPEPASLVMVVWGALLGGLTARRRRPHRNIFRGCNTTVSKTPSPRPSPRGRGVLIQALINSASQ